ncbi:MAG: F-type H+-transporting ATPase subunit b [Fusobacteria bacterium]|nr:MAG: F-type H+-transporting ATPase subunit b [Fusobacteriota bacterium]KAF0229798.1 MAG: F-type H+-transporting ATPase subunit [Fusobacteriota bacterium]
MKEMFDLLNLDIADFIFQIINISILIYFLKKYLFHKVKAVIDERNVEVNNIYKDIDDAWVEIKHKENKYDNLIVNIKEEKSAIFNKAIEEAKIQKDLIEGEARMKAEEELLRARISIDNEKNMALQEIKNNISELVVLGAEAVVKKEIEGEKYNTMINELVDNLGEKNE